MEVKSIQNLILFTNLDDVFLNYRRDLIHWLCRRVSWATRMLCLTFPLGGRDFLLHRTLKTPLLRRRVLRPLCTQEVVYRMAFITEKHLSSARNISKKHKKIKGKLELDEGGRFKQQGREGWTEYLHPTNLSNTYQFQEMRTQGEERKTNLEMPWRVRAQTTSSLLYLSSSFYSPPSPLAWIPTTIVGKSYLCNPKQLRSNPRYYQDY